MVLITVTDLVLTLVLTLLVWRWHGAARCPRMIGAQYRFRSHVRCQ